MSGALIKACNKSASIANTGSECNDSMGPTSMMYAVPKGLKWTATDLLTFGTYLETHIHADKTTRIYPLFGPSVPIRKITTSKEADVIPVMDDGTPIFVRYGSLTRAFSTTEGGICFAQALQSLNKSGYSILEVDNANQILMRQNDDGTYSALGTTFMYSPSPDLADLKNPGFTNFQVSYRPEEYVGHGVIFQGDSSISDLIGLYDTDVIDAGASTTTKLKINVKTECGLTDLVALLGAPLAVIGNFLVVDQATPGTPVTITAAGIVGGHIELTGTFTSTHKYIVSLNTPAVLLAANIAGYEGIVSAVITIP
jgi:hypothetical protein